MLDLVTAINQIGNGIEIERCFALAPHIPAPYTDSRAMSLMCTMPSPLFSLITKLDSGLPNTAVGKFLINLTGISKTLPREDDGTFVDNVSLRELVEKHEGCLSKEEQERRRRRLDLDYRLGYTRIEGIGMDFLTGLFLNFDLKGMGKSKGDPKLLWFCCLLTWKQNIERASERENGNDSSTFSVSKYALEEWKLGLLSCQRAAYDVSLRSSWLL